MAASHSIRRLPFSVGEFILSLLARPLTEVRGLLSNIFINNIEDMKIGVLSGKEKKRLFLFFKRRRFLGVLRFEDGNIYADLYGNSDEMHEILKKLEQKGYKVHATLFSKIRYEQMVYDGYSPDGW